MDTWIFQGGYPLVTVDLVNDGNVLRLGQERFGYAGDLGEGDADASSKLDHQRWQVPTIFSQSAGDIVTFEKVLIDGDSIEVDMIEAVDWVLANTEGTGFYRVAYAPDLRSALVAKAQSDLSPIERYGLVDDAWAAVLADRMTAVDFLTMLEGFTDETDLSVWQRIVGALGSLDRLVDGESRTALQHHIAALLRPAFERLGIEPSADESDRDRELRGVLVGALGILGDDHAIQEGARNLLALVERDAGAEGAPVDPSVLAASINVVAAAGDAADFDGFQASFAGAATPQEELRYLYALADFRQPDLMDRLLALTVTDEIRTQNAPYLLARAMGNREQGERAWAFVHEHWDTLNERFPSNSIVRMLSGIRTLSEPEVAQDIYAFFEEHEVPQGDKQLAQHLERLEVNVALRVRDRDALSHHLTPLIRGW